MFEISQGGVRLGSVTPVGTSITVRDASGEPLGQFGDFAAAVARLLRATS